MIFKANNNVTARDEFIALMPDQQRTLRTRFDYWADAVAPKDNWFHGWNENPYGDCFVFKVHENPSDHRFYGFLCHPKIDHPTAEEKRYQLCVLVAHGFKHHAEKDTDKRLLQDCVDMSNHLHVVKAAKDLFKRGGT